LEASDSHGQCAADRWRAIWTGVLETQHFVEFPIIGVNPKDGGPLAWPTIRPIRVESEWSGRVQTPVPRPPSRPRSSARQFPNRSRSPALRFTSRLLHFSSRLRHLVSQSGREGWTSTPD
jgi:hypothetical protein